MEFSVYYAVLSFQSQHTLLDATDAFLISDRIRFGKKLA